jgi:hypothetical protein
VDVLDQPPPKRPGRVPSILRAGLAVLIVLEVSAGAGAGVASAAAVAARFCLASSAWSASRARVRSGEEAEHARRDRL